MLRTIFSLSLSALALAACASQAGTSYRGEALAQLQGAVVNSANPPVSSPIPPLDVVLAWNGELPGSDTKATIPVPEASTVVPVSGQFPAAFTLQVYTPPPTAAVLACASGAPDTPHVATAEIEAVAQATVASDPVPADALWGSVVDEELVYVDSDLAADNGCFPFALSQGYHLGSFARGPTVAGCTAPPDDPACWGPLEFQEVPLTTLLTLQLQHDDGVASPPPAADGGGVTSPSSGPDSGSANP
jgi:hypothetical protein